jgi:hypothetical protein
MTRGRDEASLNIFDTVHTICREWEVATRILLRRY